MTRTIRPFKATCLKLGLLAALGLGALSGCGGMAMRSEAAPAAPDQPQAPAKLHRSLFSKDVSGSVSEDDLQKILESSFDLELPARVGVVALAEPFDGEAGGSVALQGTVAKILTKKLDGSEHVSFATDVSTELPNPSGLEGLRVIAARYRTRYLLIATVTREDVSHLNNWAWLYATGVGVLLAPGQTVATQGLVQASLFDVKNGTVLYTTVEPFETSSQTWLIGGGRQQAEDDGEAVAKATKRLAKKVLVQNNRLARWVERENRKEARHAELASAD